MPPTNTDLLQQALQYFQSLGWTVIGDPNSINQSWNGADLVFSSADGRVLAVELKNVAGSVNLGTLGESATYGDYGGSIDRIVRQAGRFRNSDIAQLRLMSQAILRGQDAGTLENALFTSSKATSVSDSAASVFDGVFRARENADVVVQKGIAELNQPNRWAQAAAAFQALKVAASSLGNALGGTIVEMPFIYFPVYMIPPRPGEISVN